jgi:phage anti-repressor protein
MTEVTTIAFPAISKVLIGDYVVETVDARAVHRALKVGRDFSNWIKDRIESYNFIANQDFTVFSKSGENPSGGRPTLDYAITLDMAKELAMVERSPIGRSVRRHFIDAERHARVLEAPLHQEAMQAVIDDRVKKAVATALSVAINELLANRLTAIRYGKTAGQIWRLHGYPPIRITRWFSHKLVLAGCEIEGKGRGELGLMRARLFDPDKAEQWLRNGGNLLVRQKVLERQGQGRFYLVQGRPAAA